MKKIIAKLMTLVMVVSLLATCLTGCNNDKGPLANSSTVNFDINPNIDLVLDKDNKVVSVVANNEDAQKLLVNAKLVGKDIDDATQEIISLSINAGYISEENNDVKVLAVNAKGKVNTGLMKRVANKTVETAKANNAAYVEAIKDVTNSANRKLEKYKQELKDNADKEVQKAAKNLTVAKMHLAETVEELSQGAIEFEKAITMSVAELNEFIVELSAEVEVVSAGAVAEVELLAATAVSEAQKAMAKVYQASLPTQAQGVYLLKQAYIDSCNGLIEALNAYNDIVQSAKKDIAIAPKYKPEVLVPVVEGLANDLFTEQADKDRFIKDATDKSVGHYTYKATIKALENAYDRVDKNKLTAEGLQGAAIATKLDDLEKEYETEIADLQKNMQNAIESARSAVKTTIDFTIGKANDINNKLSLPELAKPEKEFTTYDQLVVYCVKTISTQTANVESAFNDKYVSNLTQEQKTAIAECQTKIDNAKANAQKEFNEMIKKA